MHKPLLQALISLRRTQRSSSTACRAAVQALQCSAAPEVVPNPSPGFPWVAAAALGITLATTAAASADAQLPSRDAYRQILAGPSDTHLATLTKSEPAFATAAALTAPLCLLLETCAPLSAQTMSALAQAGVQVFRDSTSNQPVPTWEVAALARGLALLNGPELQVIGPEVVQELRHSFLTACLPSNAWPLQDLVSLAWSLSVIAGGLQAEELKALCSSIKHRFSQATAWDDTSSLLMLDCLLLTAANLGGPTASSTSGPRVTREAVSSLVTPCGSTVQKALLTTYDLYMPLEPYVLGAALVLLHTGLCVQHITAGGSSAPSIASSSWLSVLSGPERTTPEQASTAMQGLMSPDCVAMAGAARALVSGRGSHDLARLKRDVHYHWRQDQSIDDRQRVVNEAAWLLGRVLGQQAVTRPPDVDIVLHQSRTALLFIDDSVLPAPGAKPGFSLALGAQVLARTCRERLCPTCRYSPAAARGVALAHDVAVQQLGWRVRRISTQEWSQVFGGPAGVEKLKAWLASD